MPEDPDSAADAAPQPTPARRWLWRGVLLGLVMLLLAAGGVGLAGYRRATMPGPLTGPHQLVIPAGSSQRDIGRLLTDAGVIDGPAWLLPLAARLTATTTPPAALRAGEYRFDAGISLVGVLAELREGRRVVRRLTLPEGLTTHQMLALVAGAEALDGPLPEPPPGEGTLLPETYNYSYGDNRAALVRRMERAMAEALAAAWAARRADLPLAGPQELLTLASIVEKETGVESERPRVAAVFINRLRRGIRLQSDPTVIYGVTGGSGPLGRPVSRADLDRPGPYNSYLNPGLPPGPIASPGRAALRAVANPPDTADLYFVADGSGGHAFAASLEAHNRNVASWRKWQREHGETAARPVP